ncbi:MAG TPA: trypsin-like peptidase domain-containing protein [Candidatus Nanoarchaeia archaeon]|nr:trypsin-like peptidase domain-containing protein [Candidatus Nanoarchaeia archaeon]
MVKEFTYLQHIIYAFVLVAAVSSVLIYDVHTARQTRLIVNQEIGNLQRQLDATRAELLENVNNLNSQLQLDIQTKDQQIRALSGDLEQVKTQSAEQVRELQNRVSSLKAEFSDFSQVIEDALPAVVSVKTDISEGSGFFVDSRGYLVTNYHVINGASAASVITSDGDSHSVIIVGFEKNADIAVLKINDDNVPRLRFGNSDDVRVGEKVIAVGNPGGLDFTVTQGIVSAVDRRDQQGNEYVQIDVPINPGNSGGPLINAEGRVIGVNTRKVSGFESLGFALEADLVQEIVDEVIASDTE